MGTPTLSGRNKIVIDMLLNMASAVQTEDAKKGREPTGWYTCIYLWIWLRVHEYTDTIFHSTHIFEHTPTMRGIVCFDFITIFVLILLLLQSNAEYSRMRIWIFIVCCVCTYVWAGMGGPMKFSKNQKTANTKCA